ncbi:hypothetical protein GGQ92_000232 [Gracilibacillus halotolerans]|uniref:Swarming motility protein SwrB n=1 Tax=Gracilibacillus halotolerans TaxID=74386 RepID=A0A841RJU7_9BACI|nr:hypothetical protein [Gracilibacillus halotolerans]MBB6511465.1 hypothetical protein [Gracilibacillus halotolerans]
MIYLLLTISFLIHFLLFRIIIQLKNKVDAYENGTGNNQVNVEEKLSLFLQEMKQENEAFIKRVEKIKTREDVKTPQKQEKSSDNQKAEIDLDKAETQPSSLPNVRSHVKQEQTSSKPAFKSLLEESISSEEVAFESSKEAKILHLYSQGETTDEIAKKLDMGKTEVELIVKIQQNQRK